MKDLELIMTIVKAMKPDVVAPVAPVLPIAPLQTEGHNVIGMAKDIEYLRSSVDTIEKKIDKINDNQVTLADFNDHAKKEDIIHLDHETRIRSVETSTNRILIWGSVILFLITLAQFALQFYRH